MNAPRVDGLVLTVLAALASGVGVSLAAGQPHARATPDSSMRRIPAGSIVPFYGAVAGAAIEVAAFDIDAHPVTNDEFLAFVRDEPRFRASRITRLFADDQYLGHWAADLELGPRARPRQPVVRVSWFAARAYCERRGSRLPTELEWEIAARADARRPDAHRDPGFVRAILAWYARPTRELADVEHSTPNFFGVFDMHGLVWEWVEDFNASMVSADDRARDDDQATRVCGGAAFGASDPADYATFMRFAFRSSLRASYTVPNLGFRCVRSVGVSP